MSSASLRSSKKNFWQAARRKSSEERKTSNSNWQWPLAERQPKITRSARRSLRLRLGIVHPGQERRKNSLSTDTWSAPTQSFFKAACSKLWAEGKEKVVRLPEVKVDAFQAYLVWVYTGKVVFNRQAPRHQLRDTIDLYLLGDVLDDLLLSNTAMRTLVIHIPVWNVIPSARLVNHIWASTPTGSPLRQVIIDTIVKRVGRASLGHCVTVDHPAEFLHDLAVVSLKQIPNVSAERFISGMNGYLEAEPSNDMAKST